MRKYFFALTVFFVFCTQVSAQKKDETLLVQAYKTGSPQMLYQFCKQWQNDLPAISDQQLSALNDTLREGYALFSAFFDSRYTAKTLAQPWLAFKKDSSFVVVQNELKVFVSEHQIYYSQHQIDSFIFMQFSDSLTDSIKKSFYSSDYLMDSFIVSKGPGRGRTNVSFDKRMFPYRNENSPYRSQEFWKEGRLVANIQDFRPQLNPEMNWIYWNKDKYDFIGHLGDNSTKVQNKDPTNALHIFKFLNQAIFLLPAQVVSRNRSKDTLYVSPQTYDFISSLIFDKNLEYALVTFRSPYSGRTDIWHKENDHWHFVSIISMMIAQE